jgi:hypothetical protein
VPVERDVQADIKLTMRLDACIIKKFSFVCRANANAQEGGLELSNGATV